MQKNTVDKLSPEYLMKQMATARSSLLIVLVFTLVNMVMLLVDSGRYFLFSASVPYYLTALAMGMDMGMGYDGIGTFTTIALVISVLVLVWYLLCWLLSKKRPGWYIAALVAFILDTLVLLGFSLLLEMMADNIMDFVFHAWVIVELIQAISANSKLKKMPLQAPEAGPEAGVDPWNQPAANNGPDL